MPPASPDQPPEAPMTPTPLSARPAPVHRLLDPVILRIVDRIDIRPDQSVLEVGAGPGEITAHLAHLVGDHGIVTAVDTDTSRLTPTNVIDIQQRDLDRDVLPDTYDRYDHVVARRSTKPLRDPVDVLEQMIARLRPGGWLLLADILPSTPRVYRAPDATDDHLIAAVMNRIRHTIAGSDEAGTWTSNTETLLVNRGMTQHCVHIGTETWTGNQPGCRLLADIATHLHPELTTEFTDDDLDRFRALMADPRVLLASYTHRVIHARKAD
ncbi:methyltransferase domain-containing protein [Micromonospora sp. NPDC047793]|uniref:class I SAM-dependent methyltransferase n=1 Tax=Micromonospora sp. NPDC047793 TaxID=3154342 RepID=UPI0033D858E7